MRKRLAAKVICRGLGLLASEDPYKDSTLERAVTKLFNQHGRWHCPGRRRLIPIRIVVQPQEGAVRPARPA